MDGGSNESIYNRYDMCGNDRDMKYGVIKRIKHNTLRWFGHIERMSVIELLKRIYISRPRVDTMNVKERPPVKWEDRELEYVTERNARGSEDARRECKVMNKWRLLYHGHPLPKGSSWEHASDG